MIKFGPSGNSVSFFEKGYKTSMQSAKYTSEMGLDCFEYSFGRGVNLGEQKAIEIGGAFKEVGVDISVHAPYFINLASEDEEKIQKTFGYITGSANMVRLMQGNRIVIHPASQGKMEREKAVNIAMDNSKRMLDKIYASGLEDLFYCIETMGKHGQIGTIEEVAKICTLDKCLIPTVDFGHVNARELGSLKTTFDYMTRLEYLIDTLGMEKMKHFHVHFSKIEYTSKGEKKHLTFEDTKYGPEFEPLAIALKKLNLEPVIICESAGTQAEDALKMKQIFNSI